MQSNIYASGPSVKDINQILIPKIEEIVLPNGIMLSAINGGTQDGMKLEFIFPAGRIVESQKLAAKASAELMKEGAGNQNAFQIAEQLDFYGASLRARANMDSFSLSFYCMCKHFDSLLPLIKDIFFRPLFPKEELSKYSKKHLERLKQDLSKNEILAYRSITEQIFSDHHPYGYNSTPKDYENLNITHLKEHYQKHIKARPFQIIISGKVHDPILAKIQETFGHQSITSNQGKIQIQATPEYIPTDRILAGKNDHQNAICIGRKLFNREHEDFGGMYILNTILGGYFGSRLMSNLREDKGYTYNIYSMLDLMKYDGCFYINTEVGTEVSEKAIQEIYFECERLIHSPIPEKELRVVKNYLKGAILRFLDGPFNQHDMVKTLKLNDLSFDYLRNLISLIEEIDAQRLQYVANKYLQKEDLSSVVVQSKA